MMLRLVTLILILLTTASNAYNVYTVPGTEIEVGGPDGLIVGVHDNNLIISIDEDGDYADIDISYSNEFGISTHISYGSGYVIPIAEDGSISLVNVIVPSRVYDQELTNILEDDNFQNISIPIIEPTPTPDNTIYEDVIMPTVEHTQVDVVEDIIIDPITPQIEVNEPVIIIDIPEPTNNSITPKTQEVEPPKHDLAEIPLFDIDLNLTKDTLFLQVIKGESKLLDKESFEEEELQDEKSFKDILGADNIVKHIIKLQQLKIEINKLKEKLKNEHN